MPKTQNHSLEVKLHLRRTFLQKYHAEAPPNIFDACQGDGRLWSVLRREFELSSYWGVDVKKGRGRPSVDARRVLLVPGWEFDVIDIDAYGSPWKIWLAMCQTINRPVTVFLTASYLLMGIDSSLRTYLRLPERTPPALVKSIRYMGEMAILASVTEKCRVVESVEAGPRAGYARYYGIRLEPHSRTQTSAA